MVRRTSCICAPLQVAVPGYAAPAPTSLPSPAAGLVDPNGRLRLVRPDDESAQSPSGDVCAQSRGCCAMGWVERSDCIPNRCHKCGFTTVVPHSAFPGRRSQTGGLCAAGDESIDIRPASRALLAAFGAVSLVASGLARGVLPARHPYIILSASPPPTTATDRCS